MTKISGKDKIRNYGKNYLENNTSIKQFFTEFSIDDYYARLPYLPESELFNIRVLKALLTGERVCIYADFDTDAVTSTGVMFHGLLDLGFKKQNLKFYTPDRFKEGYGINLGAIKKLSENFDLIISVDCGINSTVEAEYLKNQNCDLIITDHHLSAGNRPDCNAVCNPQMIKYFGKKGYSKKISTIFLNEIDKLNLISNKYSDKLNMIHDRMLKSLTNESKQTLSLSTTGVGVAWFALLNFAYFLDEINFD